MLPTTTQAIRAILTADPSVTTEARNLIIAKLRSSEPAAPAPRERIMRRAEVAELLAVCRRTVDNLARTGALNRVQLPGRQRAAGFRYSEVAALLSGTVAKGA